MLADYQTRLAAQDTCGVLVCLQAIDAGGKDGTIRHVMSGVNPQGVKVAGFQVPSAEELAHDYLWRYARHRPRVATSGSSTGRTTRRCSSSGAPGEPGPPAAARRSQAQGDLGAALPGDQ